MPLLHLEVSLTSIHVSHDDLCFGLDFGPLRCDFNVLASLAFPGQRNETPYYSNKVNAALLTPRLTARGRKPDGCPSLKSKVYLQWIIYLI